MDKDKRSIESSLNTVMIQLICVIVLLGAILIKIS